MGKEGELRKPLAGSAELPGLADGSGMVGTLCRACCTGCAEAAVLDGSSSAGLPQAGRVRCCALSR